MQIAIYGYKVSPAGTKKKKYSPPLRSLNFCFSTVKAQDFEKMCKQFAAPLAKGKLNKKS